MVQRVAILGMSGAGKTTLAHAVGRTIGAPVHHLDSVYWQPGWVASDRETFRARHAELIAGKRWVVEGNYSWSDLDERLARADAVVVVLVPRLRALWRVVGRWLRHRGTTRRDVGHGNPERLHPEFVRWVWNWERNHPDFAEHVRRRAGDTPVTVVRTTADARELVARLAAQRDAPVSVSR